MNRFQLFVIHESYVYVSGMYLYILSKRSWTQEFEWEKKTEQNYLYCLAFAIVFLRAKRVGAIVLHMQLWTHNISFNIDLRLMSHWRKNVNFIVENWYSSLNCLNQPYLARPGPICQKIHVKIGGFDQKNQWRYENFYKKN